MITAGNVQLCFELGEEISEIATVFDYVYFRMGIEIKGLDINEVAKFLARYYMKNAPYETTSKERPNSKESMKWNVRNQK